jgi:hypothetical protein
LSSGERFDPAQNAWSPIRDSSARAYHAAAVIDGLLYAIGGSDGSSRLSSGERYDPAQNAWSPIASMGTARFAHAAAVRCQLVAVQFTRHWWGLHSSATGTALAPQAKLAINTWSSGDNLPKESSLKTVLSLFQKNLLLLWLFSMVFS